ncbi:aldehyde dehydrogenase family protein [Nevskia sp.]|uniref:aldehyde dehydrogenase family protein n=1 Tax=Nevskia sp. TaxID=1929292 RepID=UPI0025F54FC3|nr:aldehyde dehydrogenase family protein [Nevskia sp.]
MASAQSLAEIFEAQRNHQWIVRQSTSEQRKQKLLKLKEVVLKHAAAIGDALQADLGRPVESPMSFEAGVIIGDIDHTIAHLDEWLKPRPVTLTNPSPGAQAFMQYEPRGVVLLFGAWNFPISLLFTPMIPMIAAGNCVIAKPNEMAPACSKLVAQIVAEAFDPREITVVEGGVDLSNQLLELPFDHIFLTGSPRVGKTVMAAAAKHLSSVTLELGGKCPAILDATANLAAAIPQIGIGRTMNNGQTCLCADYALVPKSMRSEFIEKLGAFITATYYDNGVFKPERNARFVDRRNFDRVKGYLDDALKRGAKIAFGGGSDAEALTMEPTVLIDVPADALVMQEEIFGPLLPVVTYDDPSEVHGHIRGGGKPLALYVFSQDQAFVDGVLRNTSSGGVSVNGWALHWFEPALPFGGVNSSGSGRYHGEHGFREVSHERAVYWAPAGA